MKRLLIIVSFLVLILAACTSATPTPTATPTPRATPTPISTPVPPPQTFNIQVDGSTAAFNAAFDAYFPNELSVHPGDTVQFKLVDRGAPHTVTLGTLVDQGLAAVDKLGPPSPTAPPPPPPAEMLKLPDLLPQGPGDALQSAAQPCFLASGEPPVAPETACLKEQQQQPAFNGKQTYFNSGWMTSDKVFQVKLSDDIAPGTYRVMCLLHREGMTGKITVVAKGVPVQSPAEAEQKGNKQLADLVTALQPAHDQLRTATADQAWAGFGSENVRNAGINEFSPKPVSIPVGGSVTWTVLGAHTISFNAPQDAVGLRSPAPDGSVHINVKSVAPSNSPGQEPPPPNAPPPAPNAPPTLIDAGKWDGTGFHSSGLILSFPPELAAYKLTFTKAGTYKYVCLIHDNMEGGVKVGN